MQPQSGANSMRSLGTDDKFTLHAQGANINVDYTDQNNYFGDSKIDLYDSNKGKVIIQIYKIDFKDKSKNEIAYGLYIPSLSVSGYVKNR
ncbi:hypothetical protein SCLARK_001328 [Spiroplasma clarkii]|nr:hypothetical protein [Spiroplasma clarkii]ARU91861.1 hypothetical protein SCLARK_001328 [Spiroplasma clarkii]